MDSTNVIKPDLIVITSISMDHMEILGNTIEKIAEEKAGIIKENIPVITVTQSKTVQKILCDKAQEKNTSITVAKSPSKIQLRIDCTEFCYDGTDYRTSLVGEHQAENAALAIKAARVFEPKLNYNIISDGLNNTIWPGRFQLLDKKLPIFYDVAHNQAGINSIRNTLKYLNAHTTVGLIILKDDKDIDSIAHCLNGLFNELIVSTVPNSQLMGINELFQYLKHNNIKCKMVDPIEKAFKYITNQADAGVTGIIFGSHYAAKSIYKFFGINFDNVSI